MEVMNLYLTLRYLRDEFKNKPSEELKAQILLTDKKLRDIENSLPIIYTQEELILTERDHQTFLDAINNPPEPNKELIKFYKKNKTYRKIRYNNLSLKLKIKRKRIENYINYSNDECQINRIWK